MDDRKIETHGLHLVRRTDGARDDLINQREGMEISEAGVRFSMTGNESGHHRAFVETDPAVIAHYRRKDREQYIIAVSQRPEVPEPARIPLDRIPEGFRLCWLCEGRQMIEDEFGFECACANCEGEGFVESGSLSGPLV